MPAITGWQCLVKPLAQKMANPVCDSFSNAAVNTPSKPHDTVESLSGIVRTLQHSSHSPVIYHRFHIPVMLFTQFGHGDEAQQDHARSRLTFPGADIQIPNRDVHGPHCKITVMLSEHGFIRGK